MTLNSCRALEGDHAVQDNHVWRCRLGRVHDVACGVENYNRHALTTLKRCFRCECSSPTRFRQIVTVGGWTWANNGGNVGKLSEATKIVKGNLGNFGASFLVDSGKLKTRFATGLKRLHTVLQPKVDDLEKILARLVAMHAACSN